MHVPPLSPRFLRLVAAAAVALLAACEDDTTSLLGTAQSETAAVGFVLVPLSGDPTLPAAIDLAGRRAVRPRLLGGTILNFDLAVDVDAQGRPVFLAPARVAIAPGGTPRTGFQTVGTQYDALERAPGGAYAYDSTLTVAIGQTVVVQAQGATCNPTYPLFAKLVVDSVVGSGAQRLVYIRSRINPNCGFRSLAPGLPKD